MTSPTTSFWRAATTAYAFPILDHELETDVVIIGGGITGITAADLLSRAGKRVAVLEALCIGLGTTGHSTGNLHVTLDEGLYRVADKWDQKTANLVVEHRKTTIDAMEQRAQELAIQCGFTRCPHYIYPSGSTSMDKIKEEQQALSKAGLVAGITDQVPLPYPVSQGLRIENQAQFHPLLYVRGLAEKIQSESCRIFENSKVIKIDDKNMTVTTTSGKVRASQIFVATHTPKGFDPVQAELGPYREYAIAAPLQADQLPSGIFWGIQESPLSVRTCEIHAKKYLLVIGEEHKTGQHKEDTDYFAKLESFARSHFNIGAVEYRWSAQNYRPDDLLPFIGQAFGSKHYIATGFATNGLVYGALAAAMVTDQILGKEHPLTDLFKPTRFTPVKSAKDFLTENLNVVKQYARNFLTRADLKQMKDVTPGEGALVDLDGAVAAYQDQNGQFTILSPICTHLGCKVRWNSLEKSWDCPCHGSRFECQGEVIEGPAITPLEIISIVEDDEEAEDENGG